MCDAGAVGFEVWTEIRRRFFAEDLLENLKVLPVAGGDADLYLDWTPDVVDGRVERAAEILAYFARREVLER